MTVLEAFNRVGIFNLPRKFKSFKTNTPYGEIYSCDLKFPRPFSDPDWCERKSHWGIPFGLWGKVAVRDKNKWDGIKTGKFFESDCIW